MAANLTTVNGDPLPPGTYYFSRISDTDHAGYVWIVALLSLIYPFGTLLVRLKVRWGLYGADDWALVAATFAAVCQHIPIFVGLGAGFGQSSNVLQQNQLPGIDKAMYTAEVMFILAYTLSKVSLALFVRRLFTHNRLLNTILCWSLLGVTIIWGVVALFVLLIKCSPYHFFSKAARCPSYITRWRVVTVFDILTEAALMIVPSYLVSGVMLGSRPKMLVMTAFAFRLAVVGFSIAHLRRLSLTVGAKDKGFAFIPPAIWIQIWLAWSLVSASIPSFRSFMSPFDNITVAKTDDSHSASRSEANGAYLMMGPIKSSHRNNVASARSASQGISLSSKLGTRTSVHHESRDRATDENQSISSQTGIIRKEVEWEIRHDHEPL
ncbi:hypothetical protein AUEXF2481DRAFT_6721 [Aureobasidium subglaciale EXF-2481]|uniref:Rhodopsin domain-containing protein n=1 Tax=Aureobasidium subglaciale (strain EXF-2481) TaxID=1043005 RepID=A0A074Y7K5_AURSE|nr:uncharacterized protein AUEXF2481DRAFT_6721 [Aureobasidium subglaciale EXF-2481]KEQ93655.1 hypothetical protein AUEXF2481DRAFT_6721 [Aureobasidium subglaciale EXF-2481]